MSKIQFKVPEPTLRRLPWYLAYAQLVLREGNLYLSSTQIAKNLDIDASKVAKDLSYVNISGRTRVGYDVSELVAVLEEFLGFTRLHRAYIFGVGNLGGALLHDNGLKHYGLEIVGGFDVRDSIVGKTINNIPVYHIDRYADFQKRNKIDVGILTVPTNRAQDVADQIVKGGIQAIWNFTPFRIRVPEHIVVQNTSIYASLAVMFNRLQELQERND